MPLGVVKWFDRRKGYGFIVTPEGDVLVHYSAIEGSGIRRLRDGEQVEYKAEHREKGLNATWVRRLSAAEPLPEDGGRVGEPRQFDEPDK